MMNCTINHKFIF
jgi:hypothetical protein